MRFDEQKKRNVLMRSILIGLVFAIVGATIAEAFQGGGTPFGPKRNAGAGGKGLLTGKPPPP